MKVLCPRLLPLVGLLLLVAPCAAQWITETVPDTSPNYGFYRGAAIDANGTLYIAYSALTSTKKNAPSVVHYITRSASGTWSSPQTIDTLGATGISLALDSNGNAAVTESQGALRYVYQDPTTHAWTIETVEKSAGNDITSLVFDPVTHQATIAYRTCASPGTGTKFARRTGTNAWSKQTIDTSCNGRYSSLAYDTHGNPGVAYSDACTGTGTLNCLKYAHWDPATSRWISGIVESGVSGYGTFASLAYDSAGNPAVTHSDTGIRYLRNTGTAWSLSAVINSTTGYLHGTDLILDSQDHAVMAAHDYSNLFYTTESSGFALNLLSPDTSSFYITLRTPGGVPYILFNNSNKLFLIHQ